MAARRESKGGKRPAEGKAGVGSGPAGETRKGFAAPSSGASPVPSTSGVGDAQPSSTGQPENLSKAFGAPSLKRGAKPSQPGKAASQPRREASRSPGRKGNAQAIPDAVAQRMVRRIAVATGIPSLMGMGVFVGSYLLITRGIADIPTGVTLIASGGCFLLGLLGLSYGVLSASWEDGPGSLLGIEQIGVNIGRVRQSIRSLRQGSGT